MDQKILIVEDEVDIRKPIVNKLRRMGFVVTEAANGVEGLAAYKKEKPALVLLDIIMPEMDGLEMSKQLMAFDKNSQILFLTNMSGHDKIADAVELGAVEYLVKSNYSIHELVEKIIHRLNNKEKV